MLNVLNVLSFLNRTVNFYKIAENDPCLTQDKCAVCWEKVNVENGKAHPPLLSWRQLCNWQPGFKPKLQCAIHEDCLTNWVKRQLAISQSPTCPKCTSNIAIPLKDKVITEVKLMIRDTLIGAFIPASIKITKALTGTTEEKGQVEKIATGGTIRAARLEKRALGARVVVARTVAEALAGGAIPGALGATFVMTRELSLGGLGLALVGAQRARTAALVMKEVGIGVGIGALAGAVAELTGTGKLAMIVVGSVASGIIKRNYLN